MSSMKDETTRLADCLEGAGRTGWKRNKSCSFRNSSIPRPRVRSYGMKAGSAFYPQQDIDALKAMMSEVLAHYGVTNLRRNFSCLSPDHEDANPSASFEPRSSTVHCFGCDRTWDAFGLVGMIEGIERFPEQVRAVAEIVGYRLDEPSPTPPMQKAVVERPRFDEPAEAGFEEQPIEPFLRYLEDLMANDGALAYLHGRGFSDDKIIESILGFVEEPKTVSEAFTLYEPNPTRGYIVIPFVSDGVAPTVSYVMLRAVPADTPPAHKEIRPTGVKSPLYREWLVDKGCEVLYVAEGLLDCIALEALLDKPCIGLGGTGGARRLASLLYSTPEDKRPHKVILALDSDEAGAKTAKRLCDDIVSMGIPCAIMQMPDGCKDPNDVLKAIGGA